jgi:hypothetical protein
MMITGINPININGNKLPVKGKLIPNKSPPIKVNASKCAGFKSMKQKYK